MSAQVVTGDEQTIAYLESRIVERDAVIREALILLRRNDYDSMQKARIMLERAVSALGVT